MKIDRLISIIMLLLQHDKISAPKLAEMFEVSPRTIYRDIDVINSAGVPIVSYPGLYGGIGIMEQYKIDKKLFTISDITTLLIGLGSIPSTMSSDNILTAMAKVKGLITSEQLSNIESESSKIVIDHTPWFGDNSQKSHLICIKTALNENRLITFEYSAQNGVKSQRKIEPYRLVLKNSNWYIQGYCTSRSDFRTFRISRIASLQLLEEVFIPREFDNKLLDIADTVIKKSIPIKLLVDESIRDLFLGICGEKNIEPYEQNKLLVHFPFVEDEYWYGMILRLGDKCECLEPEHVRLEIIRRLENTLNIYKKEY